MLVFFNVKLFCNYNRLESVIYQINTCSAELFNFEQEYYSADRVESFVVCWHILACISKIQKGRRDTNTTLDHIKEKEKVIVKNFVLLDCAGFQIYLIVENGE